MAPAFYHTLTLVHTIQLALNVYFKEYTQYLEDSAAKSPPRDSWKAEGRG